MIGQRIREARIIAGKTQDEVVVALKDYGVSLTKAALSKYERGGSEPRGSFFKHLGDVLEVPVEYFLSEPQVAVEWLAFRKRADTTAREEERVKIEANKYVESFVSLSQRLGAFEPKPFPPAVSTDSLEMAEMAAKNLRQEWGLADRPIESMVGLLEERDSIVVEVTGNGETYDGLSGFANGSVPVIVIDPLFEDDRKRFTLAHELGHLIMNIDKVSDERQSEKLAHRFASAFLLPQSIVFKELGAKRNRLSFEELQLLKTRFGVSMQAWIYRAKDCGVINDQHYNYLFDQMSRLGLRRKEPIEYKGNEKPQRLKQMVYRAMAEGILNQCQGNEILK